MNFPARHGSATRLVFLLILGMLAAQLTPAVQAHADDQFVNLLQQRYRSLTSLRFSFTQETSGQLSGRPRTGSGDGVLSKSAGGTMMRWNYHLPEEQVVISDGVTVSMYFAQLKQMIIAPADTAQADVLLSFFTGDRRLEELFLVVLADANVKQEGKPSGKELLLVPRHPHPQISQARMIVGDDNIIKYLEIIDHLETKTTISFTDIQIDPFSADNQAVIEETFTFTPPPGTEIIRQ